MELKVVKLFQAMAKKETIKGVWIKVRCKLLEKVKFFLTFFSGRERIDDSTFFKTWVIEFSRFFFITPNSMQCY